MSNSLDHMDGWELFSTPFSSPTRTATAPPRQQAGRPQPSEAAQHNTTPTAAQRNSSSAQTYKTPQPARQMADAQQKPSTVKQSNSTPVTPAPASDKKPVPKAPTPFPAQAAPTKQEPEASPKAPANTKPATPQKELTLDLSSGSGTAPIEDDTAKRKAHEASEAKLKAEFDERQRTKKQAEEAALQKLNAMSDEEAIAASVKRVSADVERITRRNMKECVAAYIMERARQDTVFAKRVLHPSKSIYNCFKYINRMAKAYIQQEMAENDIRPENGIYGGSVPDDIVYQYSVDYYNSDDLPEDEVTEEKFIPKPYVPAPSKPAKSAKKSSKKSNKKQSDGYEQMSLEGVIG